MKTNENLQKEVQDALKCQILLHAAEIGVTVHDGIVTLSGTVNAYYKKIAAEKAAREVDGVSAVIQNITVTHAKSMTKSNIDIVVAVVHALQNCSHLPKNKISIKFENGTITLEGDLPHNDQKAAAKTAIENIIGVTSICNNIQIVSDKDDQFEKDHLEHTLENNPIFFKNIVVAVSSSKITLTGHVTCIFEKQEVGRLAKLTPGVSSVHNKLTVPSPYAEAMAQPFYQ